MPELIEQMYTSQQIVIPPKFPYILKKYCKAAIKTQPYDLLRWSYEYFTALSENRPPPVKLRLEYPIYTTEGGLTRGCLKVLANQLCSPSEIPLTQVKAAWQGFCLDPHELNRLFCLCEVYMRQDNVPFLHFIAVAAGLLTKTLTHTMILLCETLTKEPEGGSAAIPVDHFLEMYKFLAEMDASHDVKYVNGFKEGYAPTKSESIIEEEEEAVADEKLDVETSSEEFWQDDNLQKLNITNDVVSQSARLSDKLNMPVIGRIQRSPSVERAGEIERENYLRERKGRAAPSEEVDKKLKEMSGDKLPKEEMPESVKKPKEVKVDQKKEVEIIVIDEDDNELPYEIFGEPKSEIIVENEEILCAGGESELLQDDGEEKISDAERIKAFVDKCYESREERRIDLEQTFEDIEAIVDRFKAANYDLGMVAGRQMSTTSGEFIVGNIEKEIMDYINEQIAILPDPDLKRKKAKPEEVEMIREILENFLDENMDVIVPEVEEVEEEEEPIPDIIQVYAVPGIGPPVDPAIIREFRDYALDVCIVQTDMFMPRNIRHFMCPPLEKCEEQAYESKPIKEEVATGGVITDYK